MDKALGKIALAFAVIYATLILIVYYTQCTTVANEKLSEGAAKVLDYSRMGLMFNLDLLGYGIMALSTFFIGLTVDSKTDKALKMLLLIHGVFFISCFTMPMLGIFANAGGSESNSVGGYIALEIWCAYFLPISILSYLHFKKIVLYYFYEIKSKLHQNLKDRTCR